MAYLLDTGTLAEALRSVPSRTLVRRLTGVPSRDRWTSVLTVSQLLVAARRNGHPVAVVQPAGDLWLPLKLD